MGGEGGGGCEREEGGGCEEGGEGELNYSRTNLCVSV